LSRAAEAEHAQLHRLSRELAGFHDKLVADRYE